MTFSEWYKQASDDGIFDGLTQREIARLAWNKSLYEAVEIINESDDRRWDFIAVRLIIIGTIAVVFFFIIYGLIFG